MTETTDLKTRLWKRLKNQRAGMLGLENNRLHMQPMTPYPDQAANRIYFIVSSDTELVGALPKADRACFTFQTPDESFYACITGPISISEDGEKLDELWSIVAAAFFEEGRDDPKVTLLEMVPENAAVWTTDADSFQFGVEIARAAAGEKDEPDLGRHEVLELA